MSREIKFRAWDGEKMHYNVIPWQWDFVISKAWHRCEKSTGTGLLGSGGKTGEFLVPGIRFTEIMQFTGLKDMDGKEIYEGDILKTLLEEPGNSEKVLFYSPVTFQDGCFRDAELPLMETALSSHVAGNIYENSQLLENI